MKKPINHVMEPRKLYTFLQLIKMCGSQTVRDAIHSGRIDWVQDNSFGDRLYRLNQ